MDAKKKCSICGTLNYDWEVYNGVTRCWPCGRKAREGCVHIKGTIITVDHETTVTCDNCRDAWLFGLHPAGINLFDINGKRWY